MFCKKWKRAGAWALAVSLIFGSVQFQALQAKAEDSVNAARSAAATASDSETDSLTPEKAIDGDTTGRNSRWASARGDGPVWIQLHWNTPQTMKNIVIYWERKNVQNYRLEVSDDGTAWSDPIWSNPGYPSKNKETIILETPVTASYLRLYIGTVKSQGDDESETAWNTASLYELEVYENEIPDGRTEAQKVADAISAPGAIAKGDGKISMPQDLPEGAQVRFCADYEQVVGEDGTIYTPLEDKTIKGFYEVTLADKSSAKTEEFTVAVPGQYAADENANAKPAVIPELQEWHGKTGMFAVSNSSEIIVGSEALNETAKEFQADYKDITGTDIQIRQGTRSAVKAGDFYLSLSDDDKGLDKEGYTIDVDDGVFVEAEEAVGAYWATRTILQILKQTSGSISKGFIRDYPKYEVRGFSLDVGRKPFTLDALNEFAENMSWYKLNNLQVHISDNLIFLEDYPNEQAAIDEAYAGFRLESAKRSQATGKTATSEDVFYTKNDFRTFILDSRTRGVEIIPEFDMPAHALPFTRAFSEIMSTGVAAGNRYRIDELDLTQMDTPALTGGESTMDIVKGIWNEYFEGDNPIFDKNTVIHIGTDEYHGVSGQTGIEYFRSFSDRMIEFVQETGRTVRMWGSLSNKTGITPVRSKGVQLNIWNTGYADPKAMYDLGFDLINTLEGPNYIVPAAGYYNDYINTQSIYNSWKPNEIGNITMCAGDEQMLGGCYAMWHDSVDTRGNGISQYDSFDRFFKAAPAYGAKLWGEAGDRDYKEFTEIAAKTGTAPGTTLYGELDYATSVVLDYTFDESLTKDSGANGFDLKDAVNAEQVNSENGKKALHLKGSSSYMETPAALNLIGSDAVLKMKVKRDADSGDEEQILCESKEEFGAYGTYAFKAVQKNTGKVGFSREGYDYSFNYELPKDNQWHILEFYSGQETVALHADGVLVDNKHYNEDGTLATTQKGDSTVIISANNNPDIYFANHPTTELSEKLAKEGIRKTATMLVPMGRIGSKTKSFKGQIEYVTVTGTKEISGEYGMISHERWQGAACSVSSAEGSVQDVFDGKNDTFWHQDYDNDVSGASGKDTVHPGEDHWFEITLPEEMKIDKLTYLPRQDSSNGRIYEYSIVVTTPEGETVTSVDHQSWANNNSLKTAVFEPVTAKKIRLVIHSAQGGHATIAELNLYEPVDYGKDDLDNALKEYENYTKDSYTDTSWTVFADAIEAAEKIKNYEGSTMEDYLYAYEQVQKAAANLQKKPVTKEADLSEAMKEMEEQLKRTDVFSAASIKEMQEALAHARAVLGKTQGAALEEIAQEIEALQNKLASVADFEMKEKKAGLTAAIAEANKALENASAYTPDSIAKLKTAVDNANAVLSKNATLEELARALSELRGVNPVLIKAAEEGLSDSDSFEVNSMKYQVVSASAKTAKLVKGKDAAKVTVNTVSYDGNTYKIIEISAKAFSGCKKKLKKVTIGANVEVIGKNAFKGCKKLDSVIVKNKSRLKTVGKGAFKQTSSKIKISLPKNLRKNNKQNRKLKSQLKAAGIKKIK